MAWVHRNLPGLKLQYREMMKQFSETQAQREFSLIDQQRDQVDQTALERIIDQRLQATLAAAEGVTVSEEEIDARPLVEATIPEARHAWVLQVDPEGEQRFYTLLKERLPGATLVSIAHRPAVALYHDRALRMRDGALVAGTTQPQGA